MDTAKSVTIISERMMVKVDFIGLSQNVVGKKENKIDFST